MAWAGEVLGSDSSALRARGRAQVADMEVVRRRKIREAGGRRWTSWQEAQHCFWKLPVCVHPVGKSSSDHATQSAARRGPRPNCARGRFR